MHETAKQMLNLMFRENETICVSNSKYGYHSVPLENAISDRVILLPKEETAVKMGFKDSMEAMERVDTEYITLCALNPIKGFREDANCTAFRSFLVEMDYGPLEEQMAYIKKLGMPFSAAIFSGNKSLHFLISLDKDLPSEKVYRLFSEWILNIATLADQNTKNPSRSIRVPGAIRIEENPNRKELKEAVYIAKHQELREYKGAVKLEDLVEWLRRHPDAKPKERRARMISDKPDFGLVKPWVVEKLVNGIRPPNRNKQWFTVAVEFALAGYSEDATMDMLEKYFEPERDFKDREWKAAIRSAFKWSYERKR